MWLDWLLFSYREETTCSAHWNLGIFIIESVSVWGGSDLSAWDSGICRISMINLKDQVIQDTSCFQFFISIDEYIKRDFPCEI